MSIKGGFRGWHAWLSFALALPIILVSLTSVFLAHDKELGLKGVPVDAGWLPGYGMGPEYGGGLEIRVVHRAADGTDYVGGKQGLFIRAADGLTAVTAFAGLEVRGLADAASGLVVASKAGVWVGGGDAWRKITGAEAWSVSARSDGVVTATLKDDAVLISADGGRTWGRDGALAGDVARFAATAPPRPLTLHNLVMDLHTGKAILGDAKWLWIDLTGGAMVFLTVSGLVLWLRTRRGKLKTATSRAAKAAPQAGRAGTDAAAARA